MPLPAPVAPRQMLPPPTTTATSTFSSVRTSAISWATWNTTSPSMELPPLPANASPDSLRTTRFHLAPLITVLRCDAEGSSRRAERGTTARGPPGSTSTDEHLGEAHDLRRRD